MREYEAAAVHMARALAELIEQGAADESRAAALARAAARAPLQPTPAAVALGAPQLHLGVLFITEPPRLVVFQQNNTATLQHFWRTLAAAWNASTAVWGSSWLSCERPHVGLWSGVAAARGIGPARAAAALFRTLSTVPCEEALYDALGGPPRCDTETTECRVGHRSDNSERPMQVRTTFL